MSKKNVIALETLFSFLSITDWMTVSIGLRPNNWQLFQNGKEICQDCIVKRTVFHNNGESKYVLNFFNLYTNKLDHTIHHETLEELIRDLRNSLKGMVLVIVCTRGAEFPDEFWIEGLA